MASGGFTYSPNINDTNTGTKFFSVCVDNFFKDPDSIREFALSLPKEPDPVGGWPGFRTTVLQDIDREFWNILILKSLSTYFDLKHDNIKWEDSRVVFQLIPPYSGKKNNGSNVGWIHKDVGFDLAGLIYLTPDADPDSGTSLFNLKKEKEDIFLDNMRQSAKHMWKKERDKISEEDYIKQLNAWNENFIEKNRFQNIYNRLIMYDAQEFHRANNFYTGSSDRLTCVFFLKGVQLGGQFRSGRYPQNRVVDFENFDDKLTWRINSLTKGNENV